MGNRSAAVAALSVWVACGPSAPQRQRVATAPAKASADVCLVAGAGDAERPRLQVQSAHRRGDASNESILAMSFSPDGRYLATAGLDRSVRTWDVRRRILLQVLPQVGQWRISPTRSIALQWADPEHLLIASERVGLRVRVGEAPGGSVVPELDMDFLVGVPNADPVAWLDVNAEAAYLVGADGKLMRRGNELVALRAAGRIRTVTVSSGGQRAVTVHGKDGLAVFDLAAPAAAPVRVALPEAVYDVTASADGRVLVTEGKDYRSHVVDLTGPTPRIAPLAGGRKVASAALSHDGARAVFVTMPERTVRRVEVVERASGKTLWWRDQHDVLDERLIEVAFDPTGAQVAVAGGGGAIALLDANTGRAQGVLGAPVRMPDAVHFINAGELLVTHPSHLRDFTLDNAPARITTWSLAQAEVTAQLSVEGLAGVAVHGDSAVSIARTRSAVQACEWGGQVAIDRVSTEALRRVPGGTFGARSRGLVTVAEDASAPVAASDVEQCFEYTTGVVPSAGALADGYLLHNQYGTAISLRSVNGTPDVVLADSKQLHTRLAVAANGSTVLGVANDSLSVWDASSGARLRSIPVPGVLLAASISPAGSAVAVAGQRGPQDFAPVVHVLPARAEGAGVQIDAGDGVSATAFVDDGAELLVGRDDGAVLHVRNGAVVATRKGSGAVASIAVHAPTRRAAVVTSDGGIDVWDIDAMTVMATLREFADDEWLASTPDGFYTGSFEVSDRLGWVFERPLAFFPFEQFKQHYRRADVVRARLARADAQVCVAPRRPPTVQIASATASPDGVTATVRVRVAGAGSGASVQAFVEGRPVAKAKGGADGEATFDVPLLAGDNQIAVVAFDQTGLSSKTATVSVAGRASSRRPKLWVVAVGISEYRQLPEDAQLPAAAHDAVRLAKRLEAEAGPDKPYRDVDVQVLDAYPVTPAAIRAALGRLGAMDKDDLAVVLLAGHGIKLDDGNMVFLTSDTRATTSSMTTNSVGWNEIGALLEPAKGRVLLLLDACHSGHVSQELVVPNGALAASLSEGGRAGVVVVAAAKGRQLSYEVRNEGFFTSAVIAGLNDADSDANRDGWLQLSELIDVVTSNVSRRSNGLQSPWVARRELFGDFRVAMTPAAVDSGCPDGGRMVGAIPPEGTRRGCRNPAGDRHGPWTFYDVTGDKFAEGAYRNDQKHGAWTLWHRGKQVGQGRYDANEKTGPWTERAEWWNENSSTAEPFWGWYVGKDWWSGTYRTSKREGTWTRKDDAGVVLERGDYAGNARTGVWTTWHANGAKASEGRYVAGVRTGTWTRWREDGSRAGVETLGEKAGD